MMKTPSTKPFEMNWKPMERSAPDWYRDAKFGLFFHWGPYAVPAYKDEWYSRNMYIEGTSQNQHHMEKYGKLSEFGYKDFYDQFSAEKFNAEEWVDLVERSGAKFAGPVTEHADNFSLWDSKVNPANAVNYGPKRDIIGEFQKAIRDRGLHFIATFHHQWLWGWLMSTDPEADVYDPANEKFYGKPTPIETKRVIPWQLPDEEFNEKWMQKVIEVIDAYNPDLVYFDSRCSIIAEEVKHKLISYYYNKKDTMHEPIITSKGEDFPANVGIYDIEKGRFTEVQDHVWQTDDRLEATFTWCHVEDPKYKSAGHILKQLIDVVSKNGNLLLNVGPKADGSFEEEAKRSLYGVGDWLSRFGEAIYGTRPFRVHGESAAGNENVSTKIDQNENQPGNVLFEEEAQQGLSADTIRFTTKGNLLYAIILGSPTTNSVTIKSLAEGAGLATDSIRRIDLLGGVERLDWRRDTSALTVFLEGEMPSEHANVIRIEYE